MPMLGMQRPRMKEISIRVSHPKDWEVRFLNNRGDLLFLKFYKKQIKRYPKRLLRRRNQPKSTPMMERKKESDLTKIMSKRLLNKDLILLLEMPLLWLMSSLISLEKPWKIQSKYLKKSHLLLVKLLVLLHFLDKLLEKQQ